MLVHIDPTNTNGAKVLRALERMRSAYGELVSMDGMRRTAIAMDPTGQEMADVFGVASATEALLLSEQWGALVTGALNTDDASYDTIRSLLNGVIQQ